MTISLTKIKKLYRMKKKEILKQLCKFKKAYNKSDNFVFSELCFCILTPQSKAIVANKTINELVKNKLLFTGTVDEIKSYLKGVRFYNKKSDYIINARNFFQKNGKIKIKDKIDSKSIFKTREWLVKNIKGIGYKEASHFLRNIGFGKNIAILDVHILNILKKINIIKKIPTSLTKNMYLEIEEKLKRFSHKIGIPLSHLDLLFWSMETGRIFK